MADSGIKQTPFDTYDLGSTLLQGLIASEDQKRQREGLKLREKELTLAEKQQQLQAAQYATPESILPLLQQFLGPDAQPYISPQESAERERKQRLESMGPQERSLFDRIQSFGTVLSPDDQMDAAKFAAGLKLSPSQRAATAMKLLEDFGSPAAGAFNEIMKPHGISAPGGESLAERGIGVAKSRAEADNAEASARRKIAEIQAIEYMGGGFVKANKDVTDEQFKAAIGEYMDLFRPPDDPKHRTFVSPEAAMAVVPASRLATMAKLSGDMPETVKAKLDFLGKLNDIAKTFPLDPKDPSKNLAPAWLQDQLEGTSTEIFLTLFPMEEGGAPPTPEQQKQILEGAGLKGGVLATVMDKISQVFATAYKNADPYGMRVPEAIRGPLDTISGSIAPSLPYPFGTRGQVQPIPSPTGRERIEPIPNPTGGPSPTTIMTNPPQPGPTLVSPRNGSGQEISTLGPLSSPQARNINPSLLRTLRGLVSSYIQKGAKSSLAREMEANLLEIAQNGSAEELREVIEAVKEEIDQFDPRVDNNE